MVNRSKYNRVKECDFPIEGIDGTILYRQPPKKSNFLLRAPQLPSKREELRRYYEQQWYEKALTSLDNESTLRRKNQREEDKNDGQKFKGLSAKEKRRRQAIAKKRAKRQARARLGEEYSSSSSSESSSSEEGNGRAS